MNLHVDGPFIRLFVLLSTRTPPLLRAADKCRGEHDLTQHVTRAAHYSMQDKRPYAVGVPGALVKGKYAPLIFGVRPR